MRNFRFIVDLGAAEGCNKKGKELVFLRGFCKRNFPPAKPNLEPRITVRPSGSKMHITCHTRGAKMTISSCVVFFQTCTCRMIWNVKVRKDHGNTALWIESFQPTAVTIKVGCTAQYPGNLVTYSERRIYLPPSYTW